MRDVVAASVVTLSAVAGAGWVIGNAANAAADAPRASADVSGAVAAPENTVAELCPDGKVPMLDIENFPNGKTVGADSVAAAMASVTGTEAAAAATYAPIARGNAAPVWVTMGTSSYVVHPTLDGGWFASPATVQECNSIDDLQSEVAGPN